MNGFVGTVEDGSDCALGLVSWHQRPGSRILITYLKFIVIGIVLGFVGYFQVWIETPREPPPEGINPFLAFSAGALGYSLGFILTFIAGYTLYLLYKLLFRKTMTTTNDNNDNDES